ncbi:hypothetical protein P154DRAFT_519948 [Amniculicola lignicola CBS 123094]|uniref:Uncharacterized protein n=1 Tax=Amniculicola lignicola CBS 123094 TaxID=1392246 RepID=A0A6A5WP83_9PLEO|nr:hypothetical protein P154DRAFT_519948 [Amniculicola lignicola CBS 123094]
MAPRGRKLFTSDDASRDFPDSSPDPLAASINEKRLQARRTATRPATTPLASTSPSKQNRRVSMSEQTVEFSSPTKSMVLSTGRPGGASPWRIKVTVQAEPGSGSENGEAESPSIKRVTRTKTTTVPLKDPDAASPVKRRGRPRKSDGPASAKPKRAGTPVRARSKSASKKTKDVVAESDVGEPGPGDTPKKRGRRKSVAASMVENEPTSHVTHAVEAPAPEPAPKKRRGRPKKTVQAAHTDDDILDLIGSSGPPTVVTDAEPVEEPEREPSIGSNIVVASPSYQGSQEPQTRESPRRARITEDLPQDSSDEGGGINTPPLSDEEGPVSEPRGVAQVEPMEFRDFDDEYGVSEATIYALDEGITRMPDDTIVLESENFSMISVDSLPSIGGFSSPAIQDTGRTPMAAQSGLTMDASYLNIGAVNPREPRIRPLVPQEPSGKALPLVVHLSQQPSSSQVPIRRQKTPANDMPVLSSPPAIQPAEVPVAKPDTPKVARAVKAGVALQGVLDPTRLTPKSQSPNVTSTEQEDRLNDLFRGFSDGTRRELQAGLRLGQQLAQQEPSPAPVHSLSSPYKVTASNTDDVFLPEKRHRKSRLLTPDDNPEYALPLPPAQGRLSLVAYPTLQVQDDHDSHLLSPARSEDGMSWRVDTPPVRQSSSGDKRMLVAMNEAGERIEGADIFVAHPEDQGQEDYSDIWHEEASRSVTESPAMEEMDKTPQLQDLFATDGEIKPSRGKIPKTWRRKSSGNFQYSDEAEEDVEMEPIASDEQPPSRIDKGKGKLVEPDVSSSGAKRMLTATNEAGERIEGADILVVHPEEQDNDDEANVSEASDDTGMFFQSNLPTVFKSKRSRPSRKNTEKLDLSLLMAEGGSILPGSSPTARTPVAPKPSPFKVAPPRFPVQQSSPVKSSPLRQELRASDSDSSFQRTERSIIPESSPFRTQVDESVASDVRQLQQEMEGISDSSIRRVREEADAHAYAYDMRDRTLHEIEEVTEQSQSFRTTAVFPSSPPQPIRISTLEAQREQSIISNSTEVSPTVLSPEYSSNRTQKSTPSTSPPMEEVPKASKPQSGGFFSRVTSAFWATPTLPTPHPATESFSSLPKYQPWTKTHYNSLDALYQLHKNHPSLFHPSASATNKSLLDSFLATTKKSFVGAQFTSWGYSLEMSQELVVLCAVFMQLLTLKDEAEYERLTGEKIELGNCNPGPKGTLIAELEVARRVASVVMGEALRRDEKRGVKVVKKGGMKIIWPSGSGV